jgi:hypothetical protein
MASVWELCYARSVIKMTEEAMTTVQPKDKIDWRLVVDNRVIPALEWFAEQGIRPTLRTLFYRLVSLQVIPNTKNSYKRLSKVLVKERKEGNIEWNAIADEGRPVVCNKNLNHIIFTKEISEL